MKQVIFAIALLAMASLTGCLTDDESSVDETTDTTSGNTGNTNDNSNDNTDSGDSGMIDPVSTDGVTIPDDSSIFIDNANDDSDRTGKWECLEEYLQRTECEFINYERGFVINENEDPTYYDPDVTFDSIRFNGWVNKTGNTVSIEGLYYPDSPSFILERFTNEDIDGDGTAEPVPEVSNLYLGKPVSDVCQNYSCYIVFYGNGGLTFNTQFNLLKSTYHYDIIDDDNDGFKDTVYRNYHYHHLTVEIDLPFEPYGFSIYYDSYGDTSLNRIF